MALQTKSITANGSNAHHKFTLTLTENSTNTTNNSSSVSWKFVLSPITNGYDWYYTNSVPVSYVVTINGTQYKGNIMSYDGKSTVTVKDGTLEIQHDNDGEKSINFSFSVSSLNVSYLSGSASKSGTMDLTKIARAATIITAQSFNDSGNPVITYINPAGEEVDELQACISLTGAKDDIPYRDIPKTGLSYTFNLTEEERNILLNAVQGSDWIFVKFYVRTTINGVHYYSNIKKTFEVADALPVVDAAVIDVEGTTRALTGNPSKLIKYYSSAVASMSATAQKGAEIDETSYTIKNGEETVNKDNHTFYNVESNVFTFSVKDSRGKVKTEEITLEMVNYIKLTCNLANTRPDALGNMTVACSGSFFNGSFGAETNSLTVQYRYGVTGGTFSSWSNMEHTVTGNTYSASISFKIPDFVQTSSYSFEARAIDKLDTISSTKSSVKSTPMFHWSENDFVFEVPVTFNAGTEGGGGISEEGIYEGDMQITGNLRLKGDENYGNTLLFGDGTYCYITEPTDDVLHIKADKGIHLISNDKGVYVDGNVLPISKYGIWTPALNSSAVSSYTTQYGWYMKMNQAVTVGFYIKAYCYSGYNSTVISISGLPFTPMFSAGGGGMCSGTYISAGFNFQCFVAETSGKITTRVQSCNHTSQTNLSTSASGCWYPSGGGEITLSGTITFMANS